MCGARCDAWALFSRLSVHISLPPPPASPPSPLPPFPLPTSRYPLHIRSKNGNDCHCSCVSESAPPIRSDSLQLSDKAKMKVRVSVKVAQACHACISRSISSHQPWRRQLESLHSAVR